MLAKASPNGIKFDIIFIDPPYGKIKIKDVIDNILKYDILNENSILVCEYEKEELEE
ncbi:MAG: RsmD family RNA methyltransferase, partial [Methanobrevibacter sp.]|nr:RsmD family RNA methyltransferase [Methanobrevibacter sp.]